jgi:hypothetical protein
MSMHKHFIARFTVGGGPSPLRELERILDLAGSSPDQEAWFGTHKPGTDWDGPGICILLAAESAEAIIAEVIDRSTKAPDEPATRELYHDREEFAAWWHIRNPICVKFESLNRIPGCHWKSRLGAARVFKSQVSFAYWDFGDESFEDLASAGVADLQVAPFATPIGGAPERNNSGHRPQLGRLAPARLSSPWCRFQWRPGGSAWEQEDLDRKVVAGQRRRTSVRPD